MADRVGQRLGNYRLLRLLGRGGFAEVYLGEHVRLKRKAAIKILHTQVAADEEASFQQEAQIIANLSHPHIVRVFEYDVQDGTAFLVMDYAPNGTLRQRHRRGEQLPAQTILPYVQQIASALQYAHEQHLIHRDIKPENMLLGQHNEVLLSDFGIATVAQSSRHQQTEEVVGTVVYMAPEQIRGRPRLASDQYSLGIVIYEWLTGAPPFRGLFAEISAQHLHELPPPLHEKLPGISPALEEVVLTALAKDPKERYKSMQAFAAAFENACRSQPARPGSGAPSSTPPSVLPHAAQTNRAGAPPEPVPTQVAASPPALPPTAREAPPMPAPQPTLVVPPERAPAQMPGPTGVMPPGTLPAPTAILKPSEPTQAIWQAAPPAKSVPSTTGPGSAAPQPPAPHQPLLTRRRMLIAAAGLVVIGGGGAGLLTLSRQLQGTTLTPAPSTGPGTTVYLTYRGHTDDVNALAWSPNGQQIASGSSDKTVQIWDASSGVLSLTFRQHSKAVFSVTWSPQARALPQAQPLACCSCGSQRMGTSSRRCR
jgi:serine/threonine protein kinase